MGLELNRVGLAWSRVGCGIGLDGEAGGGDGRCGMIDSLHRSKYGMRASCTGRGILPRIACRCLRPQSLSCSLLYLLIRSSTSSAERSPLVALSW